MKEFNNLAGFCFSTIFVDMNQVAYWLSLTNIAALNYLLRSEIFVSEDRQLRAIHLILEFEPISKIFQEIDHAIRAGDPWINQIDVTKLDFLARDDLPPVVIPIWQNLPPLEVAAAAREEIASSRLSLEEETDRFHFEEEETQGV